MRTKLFTILAVMVVALTACNCSDKPRTFDTGANLYINVRNTTRTMNIETRALEPIEGDTQKVLSPREVVEKAENFIYTAPDIGVVDVRFGISDSEMKDIENERIVMRGDQIIDRFGNLVSAFISAQDMRIEAGDASVIAYIPQSVIKKAKEEIEKAYNAKDYDRVYQLFQDAYTAIPCTTKQWEALKAKGEQ